MANIYTKMPADKTFVDADGVDAYIGCRMQAKQDSQYIEGTVLCIKEYKTNDYLFGVMSDDLNFQGHDIGMLEGADRERGWWVNIKNAHVIEDSPEISEGDFDSFLE